MSISVGAFLNASLLVIVGLAGCGTPTGERPSAQGLKSGQAEQAQGALRRARQLCVQNRHAEAEAELRQALVITERACGWEHPLTLNGRAIAAIELLHQTRYAEGETQLRAVLAVQQRTLGAAHSDSLSTQRSLAVAMRSQNKFAEAEAQYRAILKVLTPIRGTEHPEILVAREKIAMTMLGQSKYAEAELQYRSVAEPMQRVLGDDNPDTLYMLNGFAWCLGKLNKMEEAREIASRAVTGARRRWGLGHPTTKSFEATQKAVSSTNIPPASPDIEQPK